MLSFDVKIAKIGPADLEIICLREIIKQDKKKKKKKEITDGKIYSPFSNLAERAKQVHWFQPNFHEQYTVCANKNNPLEKNILF